MSTMVGHIKITYDPPIEASAPWGKVLKGFDPDQIGGYALVGNWMATSSSQSLCHVQEGAIVIYCFYDHDKKRNALLFRAQRQSRYTYESVPSAGSRVELSIRNLDLVEHFKDGMHHSIAVNDLGITDFERAKRCNNALYLSGYYASVKMGLVRAKADFTKKSDSPAVTATDTLAAKQKSTVMNKVLPLPNGMTWTTNVSGIWFIRDKNGEYLYLDALGEQADNLPPGIKPILEEQASRLRNMAQLYDIIASMDNNDPVDLEKAFGEFGLDWTQFVALPRKP